MTAEQHRAYRKTEAYRQKVSSPEFKQRRNLLARLRRSKETPERKKARIDRLMEWKAKNWSKEKERQRTLKRNAKERELCRQDADYYWMFRLRKNLTRAMSKRRKNPKMGEYKPRPARTIPNYYKKGECRIDRSSKFIYENADASARAYARELHIERNHKMTDNNLV